MGLPPSRQRIEDGASQKPLLFISRSPENYTYKTNRTERFFTSCSTVTAPLVSLDQPGDGWNRSSHPAGATTTTVAESFDSTVALLQSKVPNAVLIDDPAEATAAVAAAQSLRNSRRVHHHQHQNQPPQPSKTTPPAAPMTAAAAAIQAGKMPFVYYYEHQAIPLTRAYFPSPDCLLFQQLWRARQLQNPRYHFQLEQLWSPGALTDPTSHYNTHEELAMQTMLNMEAATIAMEGQDVTAEELDRRRHAILSSFGEAAPPSIEGRGIPFSTKEALYDFLINTTEQMLFETDEDMHSTIAASASLQQTASDRAEGTEAAGDLNQPNHRPRRLRPIPCATVLVRSCVSAEQYRRIYTVANTERHHKEGLYAVSQRRRRPLQSPVAQPLHVLHGDVIAAVRQLALQQPHPWTGDAYKSGAPWLQVQAPSTAIGAVDIRVVGLFGWWSIREVLQRTLFSSLQPPLRSAAVSGYSPDDSRSTAPAETVVDARATSAVNPAEVAIAATMAAAGEELSADQQAILQRAAPHGVPSHSLLNITFFERQVGDKEQCHTYFALCRSFTHGMRECLIDDCPLPDDAAAAAAPDPSDAVDDGTGQLDSDAAVAAFYANAARKQQHPRWKQFIRLLTGDGGPAADAVVNGDLSNSFFIRFSNVPQVQLCRQIRLMLKGVADVYPRPPRIESYQGSQRNRNMLAMMKKGAVRAGDGSGDTPPSSGVTCQLAAAASDGSAGAGGVEVAHGSQLRRDADGVRSKGASVLLLDPAAIGEVPRYSEAEKLQTFGYCSYISHGLVIFRISREMTARVVHQLSFSPPTDSTESLGITLTTTAPPPLTFRGELRPPLALLAMMEQATHGPTLVNGDASTTSATGGASLTAAAASWASGSKAGESTSARAPTPSMDGIFQPLQGTAEPAIGDASERLDSCMVERAAAPISGIYATLDEIPDELIGVMPRNAVDLQRGRLLPLRLSSKATAASPLNANLSASSAGGGMAASSGSLLSAVSSASSRASANFHRFDVYTVSSALDGRPFRYLMELAQQEEWRRSTAAGSSAGPVVEILLESVDANGNVEDPVSPLQFGTSATAAETSFSMRPAAFSDSTASPLSATTTTANAMTGAGSSVTTVLVPVRIHEPNRILHTGDTIRFAAYSSNANTSPTTATNNGGSGDGALTAAAASSSVSTATAVRSRSRLPCYGYWYVDDNLMSEDIILSWMRRVSGRARETRGSDAKWVRYPPAAISALLRYATYTSQQSTCDWQTSPCPLPAISAMDEELMEADILQNFPEIVRTRRFRQWRFTHDGYTYFHGVTVRMPGTAPPPAAQQQQQQLLQQTATDVVPQVKDEESLMEPSSLEEEAALLQSSRQAVAIVPPAERPSVHPYTHSISHQPSAEMTADRGGEAWDTMAAPPYHHSQQQQHLQPPHRHFDHHQVPLVAATPSTAGYGSATHAKMPADRTMMKSQGGPNPSKHAAQGSGGVHQQPRGSVSSAAVPVNNSNDTGHNYSSGNAYSHYVPGLHELSGANGSPAFNMRQPADAVPPPQNYYRGNTATTTASPYHSAAAPSSFAYLRSGHGTYGTYDSWIAAAGTDGASDAAVDPTAAYYDDVDAPNCRSGPQATTGYFYASPYPDTTQTGLPDTMRGQQVPSTTALSGAVAAALSYRGRSVEAPLLSAQQQQGYHHHSQQLQQHQQRWSGSPHDAASPAAYGASSPQLSQLPYSPASWGSSAEPIPVQAAPPHFSSAAYQQSSGAPLIANTAAPAEHAASPIHHHHRQQQVPQMPPAHSTSSHQTASSMRVTPPPTGSSVGSRNARVSPDGVGSMDYGSFYPSKSNSSGCGGHHVSAAARQSPVTDPSTGLLTAAPVSLESTSASAAAKTGATAKGITVRVVHRKLPQGRRLHGAASPPMTAGLDGAAETLPLPHSVPHFQPCTMQYSSSSEQGSPYQDSPQVVSDYGAIATAPTPAMAEQQPMTAVRGSGVSSVGATAAAVEHRHASYHHAAPQSLRNEYWSSSNGYTSGSGPVSAAVPMPSPRGYLDYGTAAEDFDGGYDDNNDYHPTSESQNAHHSPMVPSAYPSPPPAGRTLPQPLQRQASPPAQWASPPAQSEYRSYPPPQHHHQLLTSGIAHGSHSGIHSNPWSAPQSGQYAGNEAAEEEKEAMLYRYRSEQQMDGRPMLHSSSGRAGYDDQTSRQGPPIHHLPNSYLGSDGYATAPPPRAENPLSTATITAGPPRNYTGVRSSVAPAAAHHPSASAAMALHAMGYAVPHEADGAGPPPPPLSQREGRTSGVDRGAAASSTSRDRHEGIRIPLQPTHAAPPPRAVRQEGGQSRPSSWINRPSDLPRTEAAPQPPLSQGSAGQEVRGGGARASGSAMAPMQTSFYYPNHSARTAVTVPGHSTETEVNYPTATASSYYHQNTAGGVSNGSSELPKPTATYHKQPSYTQDYPYVTSSDTHHIQ